MSNEGMGEREYYRMLRKAYGVEEPRQEFKYAELLYDALPTSLRMGNCEVSRDATFVLKDDEPIVIGDGCVIRGGCTIYFGTELGKDVKLGHDVFIRERCRVGDNTKVGTKTMVEWESRIGRNVLIEGGVFISERTVIEDNVFMGPQSRTTSDKSMIRREPYIPEPVTIQSNVRVGAGVTILPGVTVGEGAVIGAGCVVVKEVPKGATMIARGVRAEPYTAGKDASS